ncbi:uncharacterized protein METZ01_LOCUS469333, partial [marine metagenome]
MPSMRVFELAKELNMPARQMIQKLRTAGVPVSGNFHELSEDQVSRVRNLISGKQSVGDAGLRSRADGTRRVISSRRDPDESQDTEEEPRVITISAKTQQDQPEEDESRPRRRRRRKLEEDLESKDEVSKDEIVEKIDSVEIVAEGNEEKTAELKQDPQAQEEKPEQEAIQKPENVESLRKGKPSDSAVEDKTVPAPVEAKAKSPSKNFKEQPQQSPTKAKT